MNSSWKQKIGNFEAGFFIMLFWWRGIRFYTKTALRGFIEEEMKISTTGNPDFFEQEFVSFGIDDGRALKEMQSRRAFVEGGKKMFVVIANTFTTEAQNSLLKILRNRPQTRTFSFLRRPRNFSSRRFFPASS